MLEQRAGTGSDISGFGPQRALKFGLEKLNLINKKSAQMSLNGTLKSPRALEQSRPWLYRASGLCSAGLALSPGSQARA